MDSWQLKQILKLLYISLLKQPHQKAIWSDFTEISQWLKWLHCTCICLQTLFTIVFFGKMKKSLMKSFTFKKRTPIENERTFWKRTILWKRKHILKKNYILKWNHVFGKVKLINHFLKKLQLANSLKKVSRMFVGTKFDWLISSNPEFFPSES
jgi:hypothetical protein